MSERRAHWDEAHWQGDEQTSWHQAEAVTSLELIAAVGISHDAAIIDVGGGSSVLVDGLIDQGFINLTVLDVSPAALNIARRRLGVFSDSVKWIDADLLNWRPAGRYDIWHDRAVLHFLTDESDRARYRRVLGDAIESGGVVVLGTFAEDGPEKCSQLPVRRYSIADQAAFLGDSYLVLETRREVHRTPSGNEQPFNWTVARRK